MEHTERVHQLFQASSQVVKLLRGIAFGLDIAAAVIASISVLFKPTDTAAWLPLAIFALSLAASCLRSYSESASGFSQRCRRISLRAFCSGLNVEQTTVSLLEDDTPFFTDFVVARTTSKPMEKYYAPTTPPGQTRIAELYAHSAFFTWRLLRLQSLIVFIIAALVFGGCIGIIYHMAAEPVKQPGTRDLLEVICTIVLVVFSVRGFEAAWKAYCSFREIRTIETELLKLPGYELLCDLADSYDIERAAGANPSTRLYHMCSESLEKAWSQRRAVFAGVFSQIPPSIESISP